jgi:hypothetical protein
VAPSTKRHVSRLCASRYTYRPAIRVSGNQRYDAVGQVLRDPAVWAWLRGHDGVDVDADMIAFEVAAVVPLTVHGDFEPAVFLAALQRRAHAESKSS